MTDNALCRYDIRSGRASLDDARLRQDELDPPDQLAEVDRLGDEVVDAGPGGLLGLLRAQRRDDDRPETAGGSRFSRLDEPKAGDLGDQQVDRGEVGPLLVERLEGFDAVVGDDDVVPGGLQVELDSVSAICGSSSTTSIFALPTWRLPMLPVSLPVFHRLTVGGR